MDTIEKIIGELKSIPESDQAEVLDFVERLKAKKTSQDSEWSEFSLKSAMRGIEEEPTPYGIEDIKERFS
ncbi:MAG: DUF2281 domain-containing protein [Deltaproteobacteria bacterium]|jgi:hypothetical protein